MATPPIGGPNMFPRMFGCVYMPPIGIDALFDEPAVGGAGCSGDRRTRLFAGGEASLFTDTSCC